MCKTNFTNIEKTHLIQAKLLCKNVYIKLWNSKKSKSSVWFPIGRNDVNYNWYAGGATHIKQWVNPEHEVNKAERNRRKHLFIFSKLSISFLFFPYIPGHSCSLHLGSSSQCNRNGELPISQHRAAGWCKMMRGVRWCEVSAAFAASLLLQRSQNTNNCLLLWKHRKASSTF